MFKILVGRKRRVISPTTVVASIAAHMLLLGGAVYAAANDTGPGEWIIVADSLPPLAPEPQAPRVEPTPPPAPEQPAASDESAPVAGPRPELPTPSRAPDRVRDELPGVQPVDVRDLGDGPAGDVNGTPSPVRARPGGPVTLRTVETYVPGMKDVEELPVLIREGLARTLERYYPPVLASSRVAGHVLVELVVEVDGSVRPNSARVLETTHPAFADATLRAVEHFRFRPARMVGVPVPVRVTIPINWTVPE